MAKRDGTCKVNGRGAKLQVVPCDMLSKAIDGHRLRLAHLVNIKTLTERKLVVAHTGRFTKSGVAFNFCPFCGKKYPLEEKAKAKEARDGEA